MSVLKNKLGQSSALYISMLTSIGAGFLISVINTRFLGSEHYGELKFIQNVCNLFALLVTFGFFYTGARSVAIAEGKKNEKNIFIVLVLIAIIVSCVGSVAILVFASIQDAIFGNELSIMIVISAPLLICFVFQAMLNNYLQGSGHIYILSVFKIFPSVLYVFFVGVYVLFFDFDLTSAVVLQIAGFSLPILYCVFKYSVGGGFDSKILKQQVVSNKAFGFHVYLGSIVGVGSNYFSVLIVAYMLDVKSVGFLGLAVTLCAPLQMIPGVIGTSFYKEFSKYKDIPLSILVGTSLLSFSALFIFYWVCEWAILLLYGNEFIEVVDVVRVMSFGYLFYGFGDFFNRFVSAHGKGKALRNISICVGVMNIIGYMFFVSEFGLLGAGVAAIFAGVSYGVLMCFYYYKMINIPGFAAGMKG